MDDGAQPTTATVLATQVFEGYVQGDWFEGPDLYASQRKEHRLGLREHLWSLVRRLPREGPSPRVRVTVEILSEAPTMPIWKRREHRTAVDVALPS